MDVVEFLFARIEDDERAARKLLQDRAMSQSGRWYEQRLLRECDAKRSLIRIVEAARQAGLARMVSTDPADGHWVPEAIEWTGQALNALALPYRDHPDFQEDWKLPGLV
jgi:Family of unknown function (DUF6221)